MYQKPNKAYTECKLIIDTFIFWLHFLSYKQIYHYF